MEFYNRIDEHGRFLGLKVISSGNGQLDSHTISYVQALKCELEILEDPNQYDISAYFKEIFK